MRLGGGSSAKPKQDATVTPRDATVTPMEATATTQDALKQTGSREDFTEIMEDFTDTRVFLHPEGQFWYFIEQDTMPNNLKLDYKTFRQDMETIITIKKLAKTSLNKPNRPCEESKDYVWSDCLNRIFRQKHCQDPWTFKPTLSQPVCTNLSEILESYGSRWSSHDRFDTILWDMPFMGRRELANITREGRKCPVPCSSLNYDIDVTYRPKKK